MSQIRFKFGDGNRLSDQSFVWKFISNGNPPQSIGYIESTYLPHEKVSWSIKLGYCSNLLTGYVISCTGSNLDHRGCSLYLHRYHLSVVDDMGAEMWSSGTIQSSFYKWQQYAIHGRVLPFPSSLIIQINDHLKARKDCFAVLNLMSQNTGSLSKAMKKLLLDKDSCDVAITVQGREFKAHKNILIVWSPVFDKMFAHDMLENKHGRVDIKDCDPDVFELFLGYLYSGEACGLTEKIVAPLYHFADKYNIPSLCKLCVLFMADHFDVEEFGDFAEIACMTKEDGNFFADTVAFLAENFQEIADTVKWRAFISRNPEGANELFKEIHQQFVT